MGNRYNVERRLWRGKSYRKKGQRIRQLKEKQALEADQEASEELKKRFDSTNQLGYIV